MSTKMITALKRIANDIKALKKCPLEGIGLAQMYNNPLLFIINMELMKGPYKGYKVQLLMSMTEDYPIKPPKVRIYTRHEIDSSYHHHIFNDTNGFKKLCIDFLDNDFHMNVNAEHTGWNPAYTISTILLQVQNFISNPDMHSPPTPTQVKKLLDSMKTYKKIFRVKEGDKTIEIKHTWNEPYPKMYYANAPKNEIKMDVDRGEIDARRKEVIKENLTCYLLRENYIDNKEILLGYPVIKSTATYGVNKIELYPIPQLLTYEAYQMQLKSSQANQGALINTFYNNNNTSGRVKSANNTFFNTWLPIYVDEAHYTKNRDTIINSIKAIKNEVRFKPEMIFDILPIILNKMIIGMFNGKSMISSAFIVCYFQYVLLFKRLCREYKAEYDAYVDKKIGLITMNDYEVNKKIIPDIGDFLMLTFLSNKDMTTSEMKRMKDVLIQEFLIRQAYWIFHGPDCMTTMRQKVVNGSLKVRDDVYLDKFQSDPNFKMRHLDIFNNELHRQKVYNQVINIITNDRDFLRNYRNNWKYAKKMAESRITQSFKKLYNEVSSWSRNKLRDLISQRMQFHIFFEESEQVIKAQMYDSFQVSDILKGNDKSHDINDILKFAYDSQKGNQLLLITFAVLKKLGEEGFMKGLEDDYGIYVKVDAFVDEIKKSLNDVKSYKDLYEFIGTDIGNDKMELDLIIDSYEKAKKKGYIRDPNRINYNYGYDSRYSNRYGHGYGYWNHKRSYRW